MSLRANEVSEAISSFKENIIEENFFSVMGDCFVG
jgi:hypothetical protein